MVFQCFYVSATRLQLREVTKKDIALFGHDALEGAPVHENTLCVTSGAPHFRTHFRLLTRCFKYAAFHMLSRTHVRPDHTVCNVWRASPFDSVGPLGPSLWPLGPPRPPKYSGTVPSSDRLGCQRRLGMPSEHLFVTPATTSRPPVGYLP